MPILTKSTRAEAVRQRRQQTAAKLRSESTAPRSAAGVRPLVSAPRRPQAPVARRAPRLVSGRGRTQFQAALASAPALRLPVLALPRVEGSWRLASLSVVVLMIALIARLLTDPHLYVDGINLGGNSLVPGEEIYAQSGVAQQHIAWVDPQWVAQKVTSVSGIASATVKVRWPNSVTIMVQERAPVLLWQAGDGKWWVDAEGHRFKMRDPIPGVLPILVDDVLPGTPASTAQAVPLAAVQGALQLKQLRPNIEMLHYDSLHGMSYQDGRNWRGYFGVGLDMAEKLAVYETLVENLLSRGIHPTVVSVENLKAPFYRQ